MTTYYLRVKRPRHVDPPCSLRVDGLGEEANKKARPNTVENLAELLHQSTYIQQNATTRNLSRSNTLPLSNATSAVWRRVDHAHEKRSFSYVNALLEEEGEEDDGGEPNSKRRRLALTLVHDDTNQTMKNTTPPIVEKKRNVILDPRSRLVQESLESVLSGTVTIAQHLDFIANDSRLADTPRVWLAWQDVRSQGNILHAAALLNDLEGASSILAWNVSSLVTCQNEHGQTPYQVATAVGHDAVAQVLEQDTNNAMMQDDDDEYVYDVFCLDKEVKDIENEQEPLNVELKGGIGYWNEHGDLILEATQEMQVDDSTDEEEDSNCEDYVANDYPEEEEEFWDTDEEEQEYDFRHRPIYMGNNTAGVQVANRPTVADEDEEYDAQYDLYEPSGPTREYAYDAELDGENDD